uniref:Uncharacterized protein n=1 Tax=Plectus sambesii TaxID=2011161 RepID=A0A914V8H0_9BILA
MFIIFGLIIIGLSLVSMCINVVQIKLEHFFEDLLLMMMEEYENAQLTEDGTLVGPPDMQHGLGMMQMWRMWKKRRQ